jgi:hypothetical protein
MAPKQPASLRAVPDLDQLMDAALEDQLGSR